MQKTILNRFLTGGIALGLALASTAFGQGVTTSALNGFVTDPQGAPVANASVTVVHESSGTRATATTRANGQYDVTGLRPGGPYTVAVTASGFQAQSQKDLNLSLGESATVSFTLSSEVVVMEAMKVTDTKDTTFGAGRMGSGTTFDSASIAAIPSIRQDPQDVANNDPRFTLTLNTSTGEFALSAQGQNFRYNSFLIDGVQANDTFGLNGNGTASWFSLVPFDAMAGFNIDMQPYDAERTGFTGALLSTVIKSGTNDLSGSVSFRYSNQGLRAKNPVTNVREVFKQRDWVGTVGGPIIKDKLFYFFAYEDFRKQAPPPNVNFVPSATDLAKILAAAKAYGYDAGALAAPSNIFYGKTFLGKLDWNISDQHRASVTYRRNDSSEPAFANVSGATFTSLSNYWYQQKRLQFAWQAQVDSNWTPDLHTQFTAAYVKTNDSPINNGKAFPEVIINGVTGTNLTTGATITNGGLDFGTEFSRQLNQIFFNEIMGKFYADYTWGNHKLKFGGDTDKQGFTNNFAQAVNGSYTFNTIPALGISGPDAFVAGTPATGLTLAIPFPGFAINQAFSHYSFTDFGLLAQDTWRPSASFMMTYGVRFDDPYVPGKPAFNAAFQNAFGYANNTTGTGNYTIAPRFGFNYEVPKDRGWFTNMLGGRRTQLRGGLGLFQGTNPQVWVSNSFSNTGALGRVGVSNASGVPGLTFNPNPATQTAPAGSPPVPVINVQDPGFHPPVSWKGNLALDHKLPWANLTLTLETDFSFVKQAAFVTSVNLQTAAATGGTAFMPDGRIHYAGVITPGITGTASATSTVAAAILANTNFGPVYKFTNTSKGDAEDYSIVLRRGMKDHWSFSAAYTRSSAREVSPFTSSVAQSNFNGRAYFNPNENVASTTNYVVPDKFAVSLAREFNFFQHENTTTLVSLAFRAQSGHSFSWVFRGDANGDAFSGNDLLYVPTGPNDPKVTWAAANEATDFFNFVQNTDLKNYMGRVVPRNSSFGPWQHTIDLHFSQDIPVSGKVKLQAFVDVLNVANFFNKTWGIVEGMDFPYERRIAGTTYNAATNQYQYVFNGNTLDPITTFTELSRWQVQVGGKLSF